MEPRAFERAFLLDYFWFGRMIGPHEARVLSQAHDADKDPDKRLAYFAALDALLVQQCDEVARWIVAFRRWATDHTWLTETLLRIGPGEANLGDAISGIGGGPDLLAVCGIHADRVLAERFTAIQVDLWVADIWHGLEGWANQTGEQTKGHSRSISGMTYFSSAAIFETPPIEMGPFALRAEDRHAPAIKYLYVDLYYDASRPSIVTTQIEGLANALGDLIVLHLLQEYPDAQVEIERLAGEKPRMLLLPTGPEVGAGGYSL